MKGIRLCGAALALLAVVGGLTACSEDNGEDRIWDFAPINLRVSVEDASGNDLLNPNTPGSLAEQSIQVIVREKTYEKDAEAQDVLSSRAYLAVFTGMQTRVSESGKYYLEIGEFFGNQNVSNETAVIVWNDGTRDTLSFSNRLSWDGDEPDIDRHFFLNGKENSDAHFTIVK